MNSLWLLEGTSQLDIIVTTFRVVAGAAVGADADAVLAGTNDGGVALFRSLAHSDRQLLHRLSGSVTVVDTLDCVWASCSTEASVCAVGRLCAIDEAPVGLAAEINHPASVRALKLWDGSINWARAAGEERAIYLITACSDCFLRLWRIDVMDGRHQPVAVFKDIRVPAPTVMCITFDWTSELQDMLVATTSKGICGWNVSSATFVNGNSVVSSHSLRPFDAAMDVPVWCLSDAASKPSRMQSAVCDAAEIGCVVDVDKEELRAKVLFSNVRKTMWWPMRELFPAIPSSFHASGPAFPSLINVRSGVFLAGDAAGDLHLFSHTGVSYTSVWSLRVCDSAITQLRPVRLPSTFVASSEFSVCEVIVDAGDSASTMPCRCVSRLAVHGGIRSIDVVPCFPETLLVASSRSGDPCFDRYRCFRCDGCEPPPTMQWNGQRTVVR